MSSTFRFRVILKDLSVTKFWTFWSRSYLLCSVVKRCRKDRGVREVLQCFRQTFLKPRRTLLLSATAACKSNDERKPSPCNKDITDEDLQNLVEDLDGVEELVKTTLYCEGCDKRIAINRKKDGTLHCLCQNSTPPGPSKDGWVPYMEAEDVIIWRKEYKPGGQYAYKVYGQYKEVRAEDFAAVQVDGVYRRQWDSAVASLSVVERQANGMADQTVLHWEVLWPRLFANRDYVYIRRHKEFEVTSKCLAHKDGVFKGRPEPCEVPVDEQRPSVHSNAKRKAMEEDAMEEKERTVDGKLKLFVIVSRSCTHPKVPESKNAIRVHEYWSHMVIKSLDVGDGGGMEFVLTYYDEPGVGGMPSGVAAWAAGRAAPSFLRDMRAAAARYRAWRGRQPPQTEPEFMPNKTPEKVSFEDLEATENRLREEEMESSKQGPDLNSEENTDKSTQTEESVPVKEQKAETEIEVKSKVNEEHNGDIKTENAVVKPEQIAPVTKEQKEETKSEHEDEPKSVEESDVEANSDIKADVKFEGKVEIKEVKREDQAKDEAEVKTKEVISDDNKEQPQDGDSEKQVEENASGGWWRYLYPFYYFG